MFRLYGEMEAVGRKVAMITEVVKNRWFGSGLAAVNEHRCTSGTVTCELSMVSTNSSAVLTTDAAREVSTPMHHCIFWALQPHVSIKLHLNYPTICQEIFKMIIIVNNFSVFLFILVQNNFTLGITVFITE